MESYSNNSIFCCVCFRQQSKYNVPVAFYNQHKKICKECDYFIKCTCKSGIFCIECISKIGQKCSVCRSVMFQQVHQQLQDNSFESNLSELAEETVDSIRIMFSRYSSLHPIIYVSFDNYLSETPGYEFQFNISFTISEDLYQLLQNIEVANQFSFGLRNGITFAPRFDNDQFLEDYGNDEGYIPLATVLEGFFAVQFQQNLTDLINENYDNEDYIHQQLQTRGLAQEALGQYFQYFTIPFQYHSNNAMYARVQNIGINNFELHIHLGVLNVPQRNIGELELNCFSLEPEENETFEQYYQTISVELDTQEHQFNILFDFFEISYQIQIDYQVSLTQSVIDILSDDIIQQIMILPRVLTDDQWIQNAQNNNYQVVFLQYISQVIREMIKNLMENNQTQDEFDNQMSNDGFTENFQQRTLIPEFQTMITPLTVYILMIPRNFDYYDLQIHIQTNEHDDQYVENNTFMSI